MFLTTLVKPAFPLSTLDWEFLFAGWSALGPLKPLSQKLKNAVVNKRMLQSLHPQFVMENKTHPPLVEVPTLRYQIVYSFAESEPSVPSKPSSFACSTRPLSLLWTAYSNILPAAQHKTPVHASPIHQNWRNIDNHASFLENYLVKIWTERICNPACFCPEKWREPHTYF